MKRLWGARACAEHKNAQTDIQACLYDVYSVKNFKIDIFNITVHSYIYYVYGKAICTRT